jgi:hypothetical protein
MALRLNAVYLVIDFKVALQMVDTMPATMVMQNDGYILLKVR